MSGNSSVLSARLKDLNLQAYFQWDDLFSEDSYSSNEL